MSQPKTVTHTGGLGMLAEQPDGAQKSIIRAFIRQCLSEEKELLKKPLRVLLNDLTTKISEQYSLTGKDARRLLDEQIKLLVSASLRDTY